MKKYKINIALFLIPFLIGSCIEDVDLGLEKKPPRLVVEGLIDDNAGPYYVRLTESNSGDFLAPEINLTSYPKESNVTPVNDATVIVSDDFGQVDTLQLIEFDYSSYVFIDGSYYKKIYNELTGKYDIGEELIRDYPKQTFREGFYETKNLVGVPGRTYTLTIRTNDNKTFTASDYMAPVPRVDSVRFIDKVMEKKGIEYHAPLLFFTDLQPNQENYYLIEYQGFSSYGDAYDHWDIAIFSDKHFRSETSKTGVSINDGASVRDINTFLSLFTPGDTFHAKMFSLSAEAYDFYKALMDQFNYDGAAYKPVPGSPPTNISNGGLGLFRASSVTEMESVIQ